MEERIEQLLLEKFQDVGFQDLFIVEIKFNPTNKKLEVFLDSDSSLTVGQTARINRYLQNHIDENNWLGEKYTLDVSSPGVGKPLLFRRQYVKNIGRKVKVSFNEHGSDEGILKSVGDDGIVIEKQVIIREGKKKRKEMVEVLIAWDNISKTRVRIKF
ncbi:MAG: ribosome maturation factor RimP [Saprospiraceae bacterium]